MGKAQFPSTFNWQSTDPRTAFLPSPGPGQSVAGNSPPSGVILGSAASTNVIYSNILGTRQSDNIGIEFAWTGTPTGTFQVLASNSGANFYPYPGLTLTQPAGSASGYLLPLIDCPYQYLMLIYTNSSGSGTVAAYVQAKAKNS